ncbi:viomycin phosphotransferase [Actinomadura alba]|uniref:Viomycin phosphotransferase n=1 Tax=Actinomadura alba TaxID=406431 RepID=A0ABR7LX28_9ACTN|nr:viomycin phosphotransferase [Actinomadura alba]MBC6468958.1 viomycin phosphotransferase [Actinomadura alba]
MEGIEAHRALLGRLLPDDALDELTLRRGQFHDVVMGSDRVVCFARTKAAAGRLHERAAVLRVLTELDLGFRTPEPLFEGGAQGTGEPPFLVLGRIPGAPLEFGTFVDSEVAEAVAVEYATLLAGLARAGADEKVRAALPHAPKDRWQRFAADVRADLFVLMSGSGRRRAERELAALGGLPHLTGAVVHGDLGGANILWEFTGGRPRLTGVIDWDEVALGDPAEDLAAISTGHGDDLLGRVLALGGWSEKSMGARVAAIRGTFALQQALYARRDGDEAALADGLTGYR